MSARHAASHTSTRAISGLVRDIFSHTLRAERIVSSMDLRRARASSIWVGRVWRGGILGSVRAEKTSSRMNKDRVASISDALGRGGWMMWAKGRVLRECRRSSFEYVSDGGSGRRWSRTRVR